MSSCDVDGAAEAPQESGVIRYRDGWPGIAELPYKDTDGRFQGVTRRLLAAPAAAAFELRYFELEPGGYSSHERHEHAHVVVGLRGRGRVRIGGDTHEVGLGDVVQIAGLDAHQFSNPSDEPFGFLCIVDRERDLPVTVEEAKEAKMPSRDEALELLETWVDSPGLRSHMRAVEAALRSYADRMGGDAEEWGLAGLLHDLDWEKYPDEHPLKAVEELRRRGFSELLVHAILAHRADFTGVEPETPLDRALLACDELTGLITATALVRPNGIDDLKPKSVKKKLKDPTFARGVDRAEVRAGADLLGVELDEHIANVIEAMRGVSEDLGLDRRSVSAGATS